VDVADPVGELCGVGNGGTQKDESDAMGKQNDGFLPDDTCSW
jgi:hypothetical protein